MQIKLTIQERLKDLRVERGLTLEQLAEQTGLSKSALGKYEADDFKDISPFSIVTLAKFYGVSTDYLLGNLPKAKGLAEYARDEQRIGRVQLIRMGKDAAGKSRFKRLDLSLGHIRDKVLHAVTNDELDHIFDTEGFSA